MKIAELKPDEIAVVVLGPRHGPRREIATAIEEVLKSVGFSVAVEYAKEPGDPVTVDKLSAIATTTPISIHLRKSPSGRPELRHRCRGCGGNAPPSCVCSRCEGIGR